MTCARGNSLVSCIGTRCRVTGASQPPAATPRPQENLVGKRVRAQFTTGTSFDGSIVRQSARKYVVVYDDPEDDGEYTLGKHEVLSQMRAYDAFHAQAQS